MGYGLYLCKIRWIIYSSFTVRHLSCSAWSPGWPKKTGEKSIPWRWLAGFGFAHGINEWLDMLSISFADKELLYPFRLTIMLLSFLFLFEFGRKCCRLFLRRGLGIWIYIPLLLIACSGLLHGLDGINTTGRYSFGFAGSILSGIGLLYFSRTEDRKDRIWLAVAGVFFSDLRHCLRPYCR